MSRPRDWPRVGCTQCYQACDGRTNYLRLASDHHSRARDADTFFSRWNLSWLCQCHDDISQSSWHFAKLIIVQKCHDIVTGQAMEARIGHTNLSEYRLWLSQLMSTWRWYGFCFSQIFHDIDSDILTLKSHRRPHCCLSRATCGPRAIVWSPESASSTRGQYRTNSVFEINVMMKDDFILHWKLQ